MFGVSFILVGNSVANCISFAFHLLSAARLATPSEPNSSLTYGIAIATTLVVCTIHSLGRMLGIHLNSFFAIIKVLILVFIIVLGFRSGHPPSHTNLNPKTSFRTIPGSNHPSWKDYSEAYLNIVITYVGWNQANYVRACPSPLPIINLID